MSTLPWPHREDQHAIYCASLGDQVGYLAVIDRALTFMDGRTNETTIILPKHIGPDLQTYTEILSPPMCDTIRARMRGCHDYLNCGMGG